MPPAPKKTRAGRAGLKAPGPPPPQMTGPPATGPPATGPPPMARAVPVAAPDCAAPTAEGLRACALRLHAANDALVCWTASREFRVVVRNDPDAIDDDIADADGGPLAFELGLVAEDDSPAAHALELDLLEGYFDEDGVYVVRRFEFSRRDVLADAGVLEPAAAQLRALLQYRMCACGEFVVKDGGRQCLYCDLVSSDGADCVQCGICHDAGPPRQITVQRCCKNAFHRACLARWRGPCPMCRATEQP